MRKMLYAILRVCGGKAFGDPAFPLRVLVRQFCLQKLLRINGRVPWPVHPTSTVTAPNNIDRGTRCPGLAPGCYIQGNNGIIFGKNVWIAPGVGIISADHSATDLAKHKPARPIRIGDNCWIGMNAVILSGVELGSHVIVGAGAVVTSSFGPNCVIAGNPAKVVKELAPHEAG